MPRKNTAAAARERAAAAAKADAKLKTAAPAAPALAKSKAEKPAKAAKAPVEQALERGFEANQERVAKPTNTGDTVTVGCKTPNGLVLTLQTMQEVRYPVMGGGFTVEKQWRPDPNLKSYTIYGNRTPHGEQPRCLIVAGFAMTPGIPADFMAKWLEQNRNLEIVTAGLIMVHANTDRARGDAMEKKDLRSGLEPIRPGHDPRIPKRKARDGKMVDAIETGDEQPQAA